MIKIVDLKQDTQEWHEYRKTKMGASDFALYCCHLELTKPIFQIDFFKSIHDKVNMNNNTNFYMQRGKDLEPYLLEQFNKEYNLSCFALVLERDNLFASLDGFDIFKNIGVEIKTTSKSETELDNLIQYYKPQLYQQMHCAYLDEIYLLIHFINSGFTHVCIIKKIDIDMDYERHQKINNDYLAILNDIDNKNIINKLDEYNNINEQIKKLTDEKNKILESINKEGVYGNYTVKKVSRKTANYSRYIKDNNLILSDDYYSNSEYFKITLREIN